jgi:hypothetical protein
MCVLDFDTSNNLKPPGGHPKRRKGDKAVIRVTEEILLLSCAQIEDDNPIPGCVSLLVLPEQNHSTVGENARGVQRSQTCSGLPPAAPTMKPHGNGLSRSSGQLPFLQSRSSMRESPPLGVLRLHPSGGGRGSRHTAIMFLATAERVSGIDPAL